MLQRIIRFEYNGENIEIVKNLLTYELFLRLMAHLWKRKKLCLAKHKSYDNKFTDFSISNNVGVV